LNISLLFEGRHQAVCKIGDFKVRTPYYQGINISSRLLLFKGAESFQLPTMLQLFREQLKRGHGFKLLRYPQLRRPPCSIIRKRQLYPELLPSTKSLLLIGQDDKRRMADFQAFFSCCKQTCGQLQALYLRSRGYRSAFIVPWVLVHYPESSLKTVSLAVPSAHSFILLPPSFPEGSSQIGDYGGSITTKTGLRTRRYLNNSC
jgi:hypothetical protein